jgi:hypothetical protein
MTVKNPAIFLQGGSHPAEDVRRALEAMNDGGHRELEGVIGATALQVTESGTPAMSVDVAGGQAWIKGTENTYQGVYFVENRGSATVAISASDPTNPRKDIVVAEVDDSDYSGATDAWDIKVITGTPAGSPVAPTVPDNAILLATVDVAALASTIVDADITDGRARADNPGYELVVFSSSGTFTKANYSWAKTAKVTCIGAGGGGGAAPATAAGEASASGGGGGGGCGIRDFKLADLSATTTVTVGSGGSGGSTGSGTSGGNSTFSSCTGGGGGAGTTSGAFAIAVGMVHQGGTGGGFNGDVGLRGGPGGNGIMTTAGRGFGGAGGTAAYGGAQRSLVSTSTSGSAASQSGDSPGSGGSGAANGASKSANAGGDGADGIVIVELYG